MSLGRRNYLQETTLDQSAQIRRVGLGRAGFLKRVSLVPFWSLAPIFAISAPVATSTPGSITIARAAPQSISISAPQVAATPGSISLSKAASQSITITAPAGVSTAGNIAIAPETSITLTLSAPGATSTPGSITLANAPPQSISLAAPSLISAAGSISLTKATPQGITITAPGSTGASGSIAMAKATPQSLEITAPASTAAAGSITLAAAGGGGGGLSAGTLSKMVSAWKLEIGNELVDSKGTNTLINSSSGTFFSGIGKSGDAQGSDRGMDFDASIVATGNFSYCMWIKWDGTARFPIYNINNSDKTTYGEINGNLLLKVNNNTVASVALTTDWHWFCWVENAGSGEMFIDNVSVGTYALTTSVATNSDGWLFRARNVQTYGGLLDEVYAFNAALTSSERDELWNGGAGAFFTP